MADTLPDYPLSPNSYMDVKYNTKEIKYASYTERQGVGINVAQRTYHFETIPVTRTTATTIMSFFNTRQGTTAFLWQPPGEDDTLRWVAKDPQLVYAGRPGMFTVTATFEQDFGSG